MLEQAEEMSCEREGNDDGRLMSIREVSALTGVPPHTLRFWEKEMPDILCPLRTPGGQRRYDSEMADRVRVIKRLSEGRGRSLAAIRERLGGARQPSRPRQDFRNSLHAERILELIMDEIQGILKERLFPLLDAGGPTEGEDSQ